jgi:hypothetical protein
LSVALILCKKLPPICIAKAAIPAHQVFKAGYFFFFLAVFAFFDFFAFLAIFPSESLKFGSMQVNIRLAYVQPTPQLQN